MKLISEKRKCNFYNVGYCKNWNKGCKFFHPAEACQSDNCDSKSCPKRHQKECKYLRHRKFCKHGVNCQFKHIEKKVVSKKDNLDEEIKALQENIKEKDVVIKDLDSSISLLEEKIKEYEESKLMSEVSLSNAKKEIDKKDLEIMSKNKTIQEQAEKIAESNIKVKELEKLLNDKNLELCKEARRNEVIQKLLNKKDEDLKKFEEKEVVERVIPFSCTICDFVGKSKTGLVKHQKVKHGKSLEEKNNRKENVAKKDEPEKDDFADKINDFLQAVNHLNNSENDYPCEKCSAKFASKEFLEIHKGATHKMKCNMCDYETGHKESMKEHIESPGFWHSQKK